MQKSFYIESFGCQMNVYDTEMVSSILRGAGFTEAQEIDKANILLLNTCAIRENAVERIVNKMTQYRNYLIRNKLEVTGVIGCIPQHDNKSIKEKLPFINIMAGPDTYRKLPEMIKGVYSKKNKFCSDVEFDTAENYEDIFPTRKEGTNAWISIVRGCNNFCTYCVVPYTRGRERSRSVEQILQEVNKTISEGYSEITLLGQNVNSYNWNGISFPQLLQEIADVEGVRRLRFLTSHPKDLSDELIEVIAANKNICNSIHLPFQSGSNDVLRKMNRGYTVEAYLQKIAKIKKLIPDVTLTSDIIVGFPTETEEDFQQTIDVIREVGFDNSYTFIYSEREGTASAKNYTDDVPFEVKGERLRRLLVVQKEIAVQKLSEEIGNKRTVLIESVAKKNKNQLKGRTEQNRVVILECNGKVEIGDYVDVQVTSAAGVTLFGNIL